MIGMDGVSLEMERAFQSEADGVDIPAKTWLRIAAA